MNNNMQRNPEIMPIKHPPVRFGREPKNWKRKLGKKVTQYRIKVVLPPENLATIGW